MISIIFAYRNRDFNRIKVSMESLLKQENKNFEVLFIDYGSDVHYSDPISKMLKSYDFVDYYYLHVKQQLWNKSRALNFGIQKAKGTYIFIADVDLVFHPRAVKKLLYLACADKFYLFRMGYLDKNESSKLLANFHFDDLNPHRFGEVNGMILAAKELFFRIKGYDEFFHFYGFEDVDLYARLKNAGFTSQLIKEVFFKHNWHLSYENSETNQLSVVPKLWNARRINEQQYFFHLRKKIEIPFNQIYWGKLPALEEIEILNNPTVVIELKNILAQVEHFFNEELPNMANEVVEVKVIIDPYYETLKYRIKKILKKQSQTYCSLKDANDIILKRIIHNYRNYNYSYEICQNLKFLKFKIQLT